MIDPKLLIALTTIISGKCYYPDYSDLDEEERRKMEFVDECLFWSDEKVQNASSEIQLLILEYISRFNDNPMSDEEFFSKKYEIIKDLSDDEKDIIDEFGRSVFETMGIYSEEEVAKRQLRKKGNDNICQK